MSKSTVPPTTQIETLLRAAYAASKADYMAQVAAARLGGEHASASIKAAPHGVEIPVLGLYTVTYYQKTIELPPCFLDAFRVVGFMGKDAAEKHSNRVGKLGWFSAQLALVAKVKAGEPVKMQPWAVGLPV